MKRSRFNDEQIIAILNEPWEGMAAALKVAQSKLFRCAGSRVGRTRGSIIFF